MSNKPDYLHWQIDGIDYEFYLASKSYQWVDGRCVVTDIKNFSYEMGERVTLAKQKAKQEAEVTGKDPVYAGDAVMEIDGDPFGVGYWDDDKDDYVDEGRTDYGSLVARKEGEIIGVINFETPFPEGAKRFYYGRSAEDNAGYIDHGIVSSEYKKRNSGKGDNKRSVSENLMRLTESILLGLFRAEEISTGPVSTRGEGFVKSNGFSRVEGKKDRYRHQAFFLDERVVTKAKEFLAQLPEEAEMDEQRILELKEFIDPAISEAAREIKAEVDAEKQAGEGKKL